MAARVRLDDFRIEGLAVDWPRYREAQAQNGERCVRCAAPISGTLASGQPRECYQCRATQRPAEFEHDHLARCPNCGFVFFPVHDESCFDEPVDQHCAECGREFPLRVTTYHHYTSPPRDAAFSQAGGQGDDGVGVAQEGDAG